MSWIQKNHEKATLAGAAVVALALAWFGWSKYSHADEDFSYSPGGRGKNNNAAVEGADLIPKATQSLKLDHAWQAATDGDRVVDLFTGIPLFVHRDAPDQVIDLVKDEMVHPPIPNSFWIQYDIDPGFGDSPQRDADEDGFSNLEEYKAGTNPSDANSVPAPIAKLKYIRDVSVGWVVRPGYDDGNGAYTFRYLDTKGRTNKLRMGTVVAPGGLFFEDGPVAKRFKFLEANTVKEMNERTHIEVEITYLTIEDQVANKKGKLYKFPAPLSEDKMREYQQYDRDAVLTLEALGLEGKETTIKENTTFALPWDAKDKNFLLKEVTPESVVVEQTLGDGSKKTYTIPKGNFPKITE